MKKLDSQSIGVSAALILGVYALARASWTELLLIAVYVLGALVIFCILER